MSSRGVVGSLVGTTLVVLVLFGLAGPAPALGQDPSGSGVVTGRVVDEVGVPVPFIDVLVLREGRRIGRAITDGQGRYRVEVSAGAARVTLDGGMTWTSAESGALELAPGGTVTANLTVARQVYDTDAIFVTVDGPGKATSMSGAVGMVGLVSEREIRRVVAANPVDAIRGQAGVDLVDTGLGGRVFTFRGFNNIFTGAVRYLVDYRKASLPSLRANFSHFVPTTTADMEQMELVLGPSSAIYGPNSANGVLNVLTRSPLDLSETYVGVSGGTQSVFQGDVRTSQRLGDRVGVKVSARWFQGEEFAYEDPVEIAIRQIIETDPGIFRDQLRDIGVSEDEIAIREARVGIRDRDIERWSADARLDWTPSSGDTLFFQAGRTTTAGIEVTPVGAAQAGDWRYDYVQGRFQSGSLFAQAFMNASDAGETYLLRDGGALFDRSTLVGLQLRHAVSFAGGREEITYGADWFETNPKTGGTIHGRFESDDRITEYGGYVQSRTRLADPLHLVGTLRVDESNVVEDPVVSPRVGLVFEPSPGRTFSASWSRGFSTPTPTQYFLDLSGGSAPGGLGALGYRLRARGTGREGIRFMDAQGNFQGMRSPCTPVALGGPSALVPVSATIMWQCAVGVLHAQGAIDDPTAAFLGSLDPADVTIHALDPVSQSITPLVPGSVDDVDPLAENTTTTIELGYRGLVGERIFLQTSLWRTTRDNFTSPLLLRTPLLTMDGPELAVFLVANGVPADQAQALATAAAQIPAGVLSSEDIQGSGAEVVASFENYGTLTYWGFDLGTRADLSRSLTLSGSASWVSEDHFRVDGRTVPLNAPEFKGSVALGVDNLSVPVNGELRMRYHTGFPVASGDYIGMECLGETGALVEACVDSAALLDASVGWERLVGTDLALRVTVSNLLGTDYRAFVGVPTTGRRLLTRLEYRLR